MNLKNTNILEVKSSVYDCGWCNREPEKAVLYIDFSIYSDFLYLMREMGKHEWGVFVWVDVEKRKVVGYKIPKQKVTHITVEFEEDLGANGVLHSHHDMSAFHSKQDDTQLRNLTQFSIVLSNSNIIATEKVKLPCGGWGYRNLDIVIENAPATNKIEIEKETAVVTPFSNSIDNAMYEGYEYKSICPDCDEVFVTDEVCAHCSRLAERLANYY